MLKQKALRKILVTTFAVFILLVMYLLPNEKLTNTLNPDTIVEYVDSLETDVVYLLGNNNLLVKSKILIEGETILDKAKSIVKSLTMNQNKNLPGGFTGIIPEKTTLLDIFLEDKILTLNFSKDFLTISSELEERMVESLVYSLSSLDGVAGIKLQVEGTLLNSLPTRQKVLPEVITKEFGINKIYDFANKNEISKVTIYYLTNKDQNTYYVPVTKYINDEREKIEIIIDQLSSSYIYQPNLTSFLDSDAKLLNYEIQDSLMVLEFNEHLFDGQRKILEEVLYTISYSVFDNYSVNELLVRVGEQEVFSQSRHDID